MLKDSLFLFLILQNSFSKAKFGCILLVLKWETRMGKSPRPEDKGPGTQGVNILAPHKHLTPLAQSAPSKQNLPNLLVTQGQEISRQPVIANLPRMDSRLLKGTPVFPGFSSRTQIQVFNARFTLHSGLCLVWFVSWRLAEFPWFW